MVPPMPSRPLWRNALVVCIILGSFMIGNTSGCDDDSTGPQRPYVLDTSLAIYPLKDSIEISYRRLRLNPDGSVVSVSTYGPFFTTIVESTVFYLDRSWNAYIWNGPGGVWFEWARTVAPFDATHNLVWKWPCAVGDTFSTRYLGLPVFVRVAKIDAIIDVPAARETCVVYEYRHRDGLGTDSLLSVMYLAPGLGWLREDEYVTTSSMGAFGANLLPHVTYARFRFEATSITIPNP